MRCSLATFWHWQNPFARLSLAPAPLFLHDVANEILRRVSDVAFRKKALSVFFSLTSVIGLVP